MAVIFLRATHAELTKAGYKDLDPQHSLFLLFRPERADDDESYPQAGPIISPRFHGTKSAVHGKLLDEHEGELLRLNQVTDTLLEVGSKPLQLRQGVSLTSDRKSVV